MLYDYLITAYKVVVGLVTPERLIAVALGAFGLYIIWICISLFSSFQRKFNSRCQSLISTVIKTKEIEKHPEQIDKKTSKISSGFGFGWKKFRESETGKPSDFIKRREALDVEINGGLLNNGKTMMRAFITFVTVLLFIFNFAYVGGENSLNFMTLAESMFLPFVFYVIAKLFYFLHNSIKQKLYRMDIESFYEAVDLLDSKFAKKEKYVLAGAEEEQTEESEEKKQDDEENELKKVEEPAEEPVEEENGLDKYDVFKKKNIDVSKLMNESPQSDNKLPFINVDSDYVIKDDDQIGAKKVGQDDNMSTLFDGVMQNKSGLKKNNFVDVEKNIAEIDDDKLAKLEEKENAEEVQAENEIDVNPVESNEANQSNVQEEANVPNSDEMPIDLNENADDQESVLANQNKFIEIEKNNSEGDANPSSAEMEESAIASVVSGFKANRSKLASGGMVIERNEPISKRERTGFFAESNEVSDNVASSNESYNEPVEEPERVEITRPVADENADNVLNTLKSVPGTYDGAYAGNQTFAPSTTYGSMNYDQGYGYNPQPMYGAQMNQVMPGYGYVPEPSYPSYNQPNYGAGYQPVQQQQTAYPKYEEPANEDMVEQQEPAKKKKVVRTKENEPRPRNLKSSAKKSVKEEVSDMAKRGRPKKQEVSESMVIENDKQFNEVLSRAEKLMRKSDEGLSESQSKRIEKEIKILMDAMNRYKESR